MSIEKEIKNLKTQVAEEAATAVGMVEQACDALLTQDETMARIVVSLDDEIDRSEVRIEEAVLRVMALHHPFAKDFRALTTLQKINNDVERVADHATAIAKSVIKLKKLDSGPIPTSLQELARRVPIVCHSLLNVFSTEDEAAARDLVARDKSLDSLEKRLFDECTDRINTSREGTAASLLMYRCGRELERVGDLMKNMAEDIIYLRSGTIVRHERKFQSDAAQASAPVNPPTP
jgi:phosphate transport system protein